MRNRLSKMKVKDAAARICDIPADYIRPNPDQPRKTFDRAALESLAQSIRLHGILQPLVVRRVSGMRYELIAGERRLMAARLINLDTVPCIVREMDSDDSAIVALVENIQRENLSFFEEAQAICRLMHHYGLTQSQVAARLGQSQSTVANKLRLLKLSEKVRARITELDLTQRHARALLRLPSEAQQMTVLAIVEERGLGVVQTEELVQKRLEPKGCGKVKKPVGLFRDARIFVNTINGALSAIEKSGMLISSEKSEDDTSIEYVIRMKKRPL